jgi:phosphoserine phosphatase RsbU/P
MVPVSDAATVPSRAGGAGTLLLVDDNPVNLQVLLRCLDGRGYRLLAAKDGRAALEIARRMHPDLVLLDVRMPGMGGFDVCRALKDDASTRDAPVIFLSALGDVADKVAGLTLGAVDYITKPIQPEEVLARVDAHLTRHLLERELRRTYQRLDRELSKAADMQRRILPPVLPDAGSIRFAAHYRTSRYVGGDYYDVIPLADGRVSIIVLDVSGHGATAAIVMAMMRTLVHTHPGEPDDPAAVLLRIHRHFGFLRDTSVYATAVCALVDPARGTMRMACAGHPVPLHFRPGAGVGPLPCEATTPLLLLRDLEHVPCSGHLLEPGDRILFYTDGAVDRETDAGLPYDVERLTASFADAGTQPVARALARLVADPDAFADSREPQDDQTLLLMGVE